MQRALSILTLCLGSVLLASGALAQGTSTAGTQPTASTPSAIISQSSTSSSAQGAFDKLSPGGQKIARVLCDAQTGGCPSTQSSTQSTPSSAQTTSSSTLPVALTRDQIAAMKQHMGWWRIFRQMQTDGQIPSRVRNLGQLVGGLYQAHSSSHNTDNGRGK
jgi:hypothetical protein